MPPQKKTAPSIASRRLSKRVRPSLQNKSDINGIRDSMRAGIPGEVKQQLPQMVVVFFSVGVSDQVVFFFWKWLLSWIYTKKAEFQ